jgi:hypothetical protein
MAHRASERQAPERQAAPARNATPAAQPLLALQRTAGNAALGQFLSRSRARHLARCGTASCGCAACSSAPPLSEDEDLAAER